MRNPCIGCTDGAEDRKDCECTQWEERVKYLNHIQHGGVYLNSVGVEVPIEKEVDGSRFPAVDKVVETQNLASLPEKETKNQKKEGEMKNKLTNLNDHLFMQLERLTDEKLKGDKLAEEISRSKAVSQIAGQIVFGGKLALEAQAALRDGKIKIAPGLLEISNEK